MTYDVIVIGAGLGGLSCGAALSSVGMKVLVLEKHHAIGGYLQGFSRRDWHWNVGTHYVGDGDPAGAFFRLMGALTDNRVVFRPLEEGYERIIDGPYAHDVLANRDDAYLRQLQREFPSEEARLAAFFKMLRRVQAKQALLFVPKMFGGAGKYLFHAANRVLFTGVWDKTVQEVLDRYFTDPRLKRILAVHCDKTVLGPDEASFLSWVIIHNSYLNGACYPVGGGEVISSALRDRIITRGGAVRTRAAVRCIELARHRVAGIVLESGEPIEGTRVVSDIGVIETVEGLMSAEDKSPRQRSVVERYRPSGAYMTLHVGFEGDLSRFGIQNANYRIFGESPYDFTKDPLADDWQPANVLISFPSIRDKGHTDVRHHTAEILVPVLFEHFERWGSTAVNRRGDAYRHHKERITAKLLTLLERTFPGIGRVVAFTDLSTPLSYSYYTGHKQGAAYGIACRVGRTTDLDLHPVSDIKGLYYTGADTLAQGITGAFMSGIFTAVALSGKFGIFRLK